MQALFYLGLFGTFFFVVTSITTGITVSTQQEQAARREDVARMFQDVATAINDSILRQNPSLEAFLNEFNAPEGVVADADVLFTARNTSWSTQQLTTDPWRSPIRIVRIREEELIDASGVFANVSYFVLASAGSDRTLQTTLPNTVTEWRTLHSIGGDSADIVLTFSTRDAALELWNRAEKVELQITQTTQRRYQEKIAQFNESNANVLDVFTTCALFGVVDDDTLVNVDCTSFTPALIAECFAVHGYNNPPEGDTPPPPPVVNILPSVNVSLNDCWKYEPTFLTNAGYPTMAGSLALFNAPNQSDITETLGLQTLLRNDPFRTPQVPSGNITFDVGATPDILIMRRGAFVDTPGWRFAGRQTTISPQ